MEPDASFGQWLQERRRALRLPRAELAGLVGCATITLRKIEADERRPSQQLAELLATRLGLAPAERGLFVRVARGELRTDQLPASVPQAGVSPVALPAPARSVARTNLPAALTSFVGRERELAELRATLARQRLLTLTGVGGVGKTRLALELGLGTFQGELPGLARDGVWLVELAALADPALLAPAIVRVFGLPEQAGRPAHEQLQAYLAERQLLLILDNCEHLVGACAALAEQLLQRCWQLRILATSREPLRIPGEQVHQLAPLALPLAGERLSAQILAATAAQLFVARLDAGNATPIDTAGAQAIGQICRQLDGIPLAIELAAPLARSMPLAEIATQLEHQLELLVNSYRTAIPRHQTMHSALVWSYRLLAPEEQHLLACCAVFAGGWALAAAQAVCAELAAERVLPALEQLVAKSLALREGVGERRRYRLLEPVRQFALAQLAAGGQEQAVRRRHAEYLVSLAERTESYMYHAEQSVWVEHLEAEHNNLQAALTWALVHAPPTAIRLAGALGWFWHLYGHHRQGRDWLLKVLEYPRTVTSASEDAWRAKALNQAGYLCTFLREIARASALLEQSVALWRLAGDQRGLAHALCDWGANLSNALTGDYTLARALLEESIALFQSLGATQNLARAYFWHGYITVRQADFAAARASAEASVRLGREAGDLSNIAAAMTGISGLIAYYEGDYAAAQALQEEGVRIFRDEANDRPGLGLSLGNLGTINYLRGDYDRAVRCLEERLAIWRELENPRTAAWTLVTLGFAVMRRDGWRPARAHFAESLLIWRDLGEYGGVAMCLSGLAEIAAVNGDLARAAQLAAAAQAQLDASGVRLEETSQIGYVGYPVVDQAEFERSAAAVRAALGEPAFARAWQLGAAMSAEQAIDYALQPSHA